MAQTIKLKRSATQNAVPSTSSLALGELAINTYDGKLFIKKNVSGTESIVTIGEVGAGSIGPTELASTAVTAGSYGSTSAIPVITIDADGRITSASTATISGLSADSVTATEIAANAVGISELNVSDGTDGQVLTTDGNGNLAFEDQSGGAASATAFSTNIASGDGSTTAFTLSESPSAESKIIAFINGVFQNQDAYTISGTTLTFDTAPISGTNNVVVYVIGDVYSGESVLISNFSGNGTTTAFTLSNNPGNENNTQVYIDGVYQQKTTYSVSGTTLTFSSAPPTGTNNIEVVMLTSTTVNTPAAGSVVTASIADDSVTGAKLVSSAVTTAKIADSNVTTAKIADSNVTTAKIADDAVTSAKIATLDANLEFGDNTKAIFGAGSDLQIYSDGDSAFINEKSTTGSLFIEGDNIRFRTTDTSKTYALFTNSGSVRLYHDNAIHVETSSEGVDVTGNVHASGLLKVGTNDSEYANNYIRFKPTGAAYIDHNTTGQDINFRVSNSSSLDTTPLTVTSSGITATGLTVGSDLDITADIGRAKIGNVGFSDFAGFAHRDNASTGSYALLQYNTGETYLNAASGRDINIRINNSNVAIVKSDGKVGIGNQAPSRNLTVGDTGSSSAINIKSSATNGYSILAFGDSDDDNYAQIFLDNSTNKVQIQNGGGGAIGNRGITLDSSENVGIGTDTPTNYYSGADNLVIYEPSGEGGISVVTATNTTGALYFADGTSGNQQYRGGIAYQHGNDQLALVSGGATKATIDASGHFDLDGYIDNTRNNTSISGPSNSDHTLGTRIKFYDAGEAVWYAIGIENNHLWFNADPGFKFYSDSVLSATIDDDGIKFNSDTAAANALDDYEEGTWTPIVQGGTTTGTGTYSTQSGTYRRIGSMVHITCRVEITNHTGTGHINITGLPFAATTGNETAFNLMYNNLNTSTGYQDISFHLGTAGTTGTLFQSGDSAGWTTVPMDTSFGIIFNGTYTA